MSRLPQPGGDEGNWGEILNEYLCVIHGPDGTLKNSVVAKQHLATNAVDARVVAASSGTNGQVLTRDTAVTSGLSWQTAPGGGTTTVVMGGDITGSSDNAQIAPGVVGAAEIANNAISGVKLSDGSVSLGKLSVSPTATGEILTYNGTGLSWQAPDTATILDNSITAPKLNAAGGANGQSLVLDSSSAGGFKWETLTIGSATPSGAAGGSLSGTYPNPLLANDAVTTAKILDASVTTIKLADSVITSAKLADGSITSDKIVNGTIVETDLSIGIQTKLNADHTIADGSVTPAKLNSDTPANGEMLSYNGTSFEWVPAPSAPVTSINTRTGAVVIVKADVDLANVDNTSDANKPISTATLAALNGKLQVLPNGSTYVQSGEADAFSVRNSGGTNVLKVNSLNNTVSFASASVDPASAANGDMYYSTSLNTLRIYKAGSWSNVGPATLPGASNIMVYENYAAAPALPVDTIVVSRTGL